MSYGDLNGGTGPGDLNGSAPRQIPGTAARPSGAAGPDIEGGDRRCRWRWVAVTMGVRVSVVEEAPTEKIDRSVARMLTASSVKWAVRGCAEPWRRSR